MGVRALVMGEAVGVEVSHEQQLRVRRRAGSQEVGDDAAPRGLVAVDAPDGQDLARRGGVADPASVIGRPWTERPMTSSLTASASVVTTAS